MKKIFLILGLSFLFQGCLSTIGHYREIKSDNGVESVYEATCSVWNEAICVWWLDKSNFQSQQIIDAYTKITYPFWVIDLPFEVVFDTLFLPYDVYVVFNKKKTEEVKQEEVVEEVTSFGKILEDK